MSKAVFKCPECGGIAFNIEVREKEVYDYTINLDYHICTKCEREINPMEYNIAVVNMEVSP